MLLRLALTAAITCLALPAPADEDRVRPLTVKLISECDTIRPGQTFHLGIHQQIAPTYHSYWRSPGTVGMPMQLDWQLPEGFTAGELLWPLPETSTMAAYTVWGYHDSALLAVPITVTDEVQPGGRVTLTATASWMCCAKSCHPDKETISITLPIGVTALTNQVSRAALAQTLDEQPRETKEWTIQATAKNDRYRLKVSPANPQAELPMSAYFYDYDRQVSSDKGQKAERRGNSLRITMSAEEHTGERLPRLRGMLVAEPEWRPGLKAVAIDIPINRKP